MPSQDELNNMQEPEVQLSPEDQQKRESFEAKLKEMEEKLRQRLAERDRLISSQDQTDDNCCGGGCGCDEQPLTPLQKMGIDPVENELEMAELTFQNPIAWDELKNNSVLVVKLDSSNPARFSQFQHALITQLLQPRMEMLKQKKVAVIFMGNDDNISSLDETEMNRLGWYKKEKSLIINPNDIK